MPCSACAHDNPPDARFCGACGEPQERGLIRPGTVSLALPYPPARIHHTASFGDETLAGAGITSPKKTWALLGIASAGLFLVGAVVVYVSVSPRGPAGSDAPVLIANVQPTQLEAEEALSELPAELPEGVDLDALVERAVPAPPSGPAPAPEVIEQDIDETPVEPPQTNMRRTPPRMRAAPAEALPPTYPPVTPMATPTPPSSSESPYTAATYGPAARRTVSSRYMGDIERCFGAADGRSPGFSGTVLVAYMLTQTGQVASARIARNTTGDSQLGTCLTTAGRRWNLPAPPRRTLEFSMSFAR